MTDKSKEKKSLDEIRNDFLMQKESGEDVTQKDLLEVIEKNELTEDESRYDLLAATDVTAQYRI